VKTFLQNYIYTLLILLPHFIEIKDLEMLLTKQAIEPPPTAAFQVCGGSAQIPTNFSSLAGGQDGRSWTM